MCQGSVPRVPREEAVWTERHSAQAYTVSIKNSAEGPGDTGLRRVFLMLRRRGKSSILQEREGVIVCAELAPSKVRIR